MESDDQVRLLLEAQTPVVTIFGKTWLLHVKEVLRTTPEENLAMIGDTVRFLKDHGKFVIYDAEHAFDGYKDDPEYALATWQAAEKAGADFVVLCDTNGGTLPREVAAITAAARGKLTTRLGIHTHDDIGLGVANALAAVEAGRDPCPGHDQRLRRTHRQLQPHQRHPQPRVQDEEAVRAGDSRWRSCASCRSSWMRSPTSGTTRASPGWARPRSPTKAGMHVNAVQKVARSFEHIDPALVGNRRRVLVSDLAGRSNIVMKAQELGFRVTNDTPELKTILARIKELEHEGYEFEAAEASLALLISRELQAQEAALLRGWLPRLDAPRRSSFDLRGDRQGARRRRGGPYGGRGRRAGERARQGARAPPWSSSTRASRRWC